MSYQEKTGEELVREIEELKARLARFEGTDLRLERVEESLRFLSHLDELTGLYNRGTFFTLALQQLRLANRHKQPLLLLCCELQGLKRINEEFGRQEGDRALADAARILRTTFRESDIVARVGAAQFALLAIHVPAERTRQLIDRLQDRLAVLRAEGGRPYELSMDMSPAWWDPEHPCSVKQLLSRAEEQMGRQAAEGGPA